MPPHAPEPVPALALRGVAKAYPLAGGDRLEVLRGVDLAVAEGEFVAIVGFSGSGKTTLISLLAGLVAPDAGVVLARGAPVRGPGPDRGVVFQSYALLPWQTALANVQLAVDAVHPELSRRERRARALAELRAVGLEAAHDKRPGELSGGMRQRVAVARALAMEPRALLLDEPLSALDALTRASLQDQIAALWSRLRSTVVLVTNDVDEAILLADRILVLSPGPGACIHAAFPVPLARPRERAALNHEAAFRKLRNEVIACLVDLRRKRVAA
jgi:nitrate/nitrite transport system ATP-binding protein